MGKQCFLLVLVVFTYPGNRTVCRRGRQSCNHINPVQTYSWENGAFLYDLARCVSMHRLRAAAMAEQGIFSGIWDQDTYRLVCSDREL